MTAQVQPVESHLVPLTHAQRVELFGKFAFTPDPQPGNAEHVSIEARWMTDNLVSVVVPQLASRRAMVHRLIAPQFLRLWAAWEAAGLRDRVLTFNGAFVSRYKRGKSGPAQNLSNHA